MLLNKAIVLPLNYQPIVFSLPGLHYSCKIKLGKKKGDDELNRWQELYQQRLTTPDGAVNLIENGESILVGLINSVPPALVSAVARKAQRGELTESTFMDALNMRCADIYSPEVQGKIKYLCGYAGLNRSLLMNSAVIDLQPIRFMDARRNLQQIIDVLMMTVSPMDKNGYFSTGINPDYICGLAKSGNKYKILLEVNEKMPRTFGNNYIHISEADAIVENNLPLLALPKIPISKEDEAIGNYIAEEIPNGACIQLGIGGVPNAVGMALENKKDLSVHSEMICDSMMDLYYKGVITSRKKTYMPGKWMGTFVLGSQELYDFVAENPLIEMWEANIVNDPRIACLNDNLMSINTTLEIDLSGQCSSETIAYRQYSGIGGQADFVAAAWYSNGGKSFIATYSTYTDKSGELKSKIVPTITSFCTINRVDIQYVVTEYGIAYLKDRSMSQRTRELVRLAHPDFRDWLIFEAKRLGFTQ